MQFCGAETLKEQSVKVNDIDAQRKPSWSETSKEKDSYEDPSDGVTKIQLSHILKRLISFQRYNLLLKVLPQLRRAYSI